MSFNCDKLDEAKPHISNELSATAVTESESGCNWNYDELNELRMKFISLLSADTNSKGDEEEKAVESSETLLTKSNSMSNACNNLTSVIYM